MTNATGVIALKSVAIDSASGVLLKAAAGQWGTSGANGGRAVLTADAQTLSGDLVADTLSSISLTLKSGSTLEGTVNGDRAAKSVALTLDASSAWTVTGNSHVTALSGARVSGSAITNIAGNGHTVTYDKDNDVNSYLGGKTYTLSGGGKLVAG